MDGIHNLNPIDLGIIAVISISAIFGIMRGFVKEALSLVTWITALFVATFYCTTIADHMTIITMVGLRYLIAFLLLILVVLIVGGLISHWITRLITLTGFSITDRFVGTLFGIARGALVVAITVMVVGSSNLTNMPLWTGSTLIPTFLPMANWIKSSVPEDLIHKITMDHPLSADTNKRAQAQGIKESDHPRSD